MNKTFTINQLETLSAMTNELRDNFDDMDKSNKILNDMLHVLGEQPMFKTHEEFLEFMDSDKPLVF